MATPIITVFGATGAQGGGLARAILADPDRTFALRAVTRKPDDAPARALAHAGAQIVVADLDDLSSVQSVLEGAYGAFFMTNFWEHFSAEKELAQAGNMAIGAARANIRHAIWSTLEDTRELITPDGSRMPVLHGKYNVPHFDAKGAANPVFIQQRVPTTFLYTSAYWENLIYFGMGPKRQSDGTLAITLPTAETMIPWIAAEDIGRSAFGVFRRGEALIGESIGVAGEHLSGGTMALKLTQTLGRLVSYHAVTPDEYRALPFPGAVELGNMFQFKCEFEERYCARRNLERARTLNPQMSTFSNWLARNKERLPLD